MPMCAILCLLHPGHFVRQFYKHHHAGGTEVQARTCIPTLAGASLEKCFAYGCNIHTCMLCRQAISSTEAAAAQK